jgi:hypothetical protein
MGRAKQSVFPVPVGDPPIRSEPERMVGMVRDCMGVGTVRARCERARRRAGDRGRDAKLRWTGGAAAEGEASAPILDINAFDEEACGDNLEVVAAIPDDGEEG